MLLVQNKGYKYLCFNGLVPKAKVIVGLRELPLLRLGELLEMKGNTEDVADSKIAGNKG